MPASPLKLPNVFSYIPPSTTISTPAHVLADNLMSSMTFVVAGVASLVILSLGGVLGVLVSVIRAIAGSAEVLKTEDILQKEAFADFIKKIFTCDTFLKTKVHTGIDHLFWSSRAWAQIQQGTR